MDRFRQFPTRFNNWPYYGSSPDEDQDAHEALLAAAASLASDGAARQDDTVRQRRSRRGRPRRSGGD